MPSLQRFPLVVAAVACVFGGPSFAQQTNSESARANGAFRVAGVVVSSATGAPLLHARVYLASLKDRRESTSVITKEDGRFEFTGLPAGKYSLEGLGRGYITAAYEQHEQYSTAIVTGAGLDTENFTLRLVPMASLTGAVLDESGEPVRDAQVRLYAESHGGGTTRVVPISSTNTDDQGTFEFVTLAAGKYFVSATATPWYAVHAPSFVGDAPPSVVDPALDVAYPTTFFGGATESESAEPINVQAGDRAQVEIHLTPVRALRLTLDVQENGRGTYLPMLRQRVFDTLEGVPVTGTIPSSSGALEIVGLPPGRYTFLLRGNNPAEMQQGGEVDLRQSGQDLNDSGAEPLGHVKLSLKLPKEDPPPRLMNIGLQDERNRTVAFSRVDATGEASFGGLSPGKYNVRVFTQAKAYSVVQMTSADTQTSGHEFQLKAGESQEWTASLAAGDSTIEGFVKRGAKPAPGIMVVLIPKDPESHQDLFRRDQSDLDGSFVLRGVIPGLYSVVAIEDAWGFDWSKPALLARYAEHGQAVTIGELMQGTVSLADPVQIQPR
jgi:uncharacterized protein (DUF2141 family)